MMRKTRSAGNFLLVFRGRVVSKSLTLDCHSYKWNSVTQNGNGKAEEEFFFLLYPLSLFKPVAQAE
jgi:hypothetical protein